MLGFTIAVFNGDELFSSLLRDTDNDENALPGIIATDVEIDSVCPNINIAFIGQAAPIPGSMLFFPYPLAAADRCGCPQTV